MKTKWKVVVCDKFQYDWKISFTGVAVRPTTIHYVSKCGAVDRKVGQVMSIVEMRMLIWVRGVTVEDRIIVQKNVDMIKKTFG